MECIQQILTWFPVLFVKRSVFESCQNVTMMCSYTGVGSLCQWRHKLSQNVAKCQVVHKPTLFCSSWVKSKPAWLHPVEITSDGEKLVICINFNGTTKWSIRIRLHIFCIVSPLASPVHFPFKFKRLLRYMQNVCKQGVCSLSAQVLNCVTINQECVKDIAAAEVLGYLLFALYSVQQCKYARRHFWTARL